MGRTLARLFALAFVNLLLAGCAPAKKTEAPAPRRPVVVDDEPQWIRYQSEHFDLSTDLSDEEARLALESLETTRAAMLSAVWAGGAQGLAARTTVVVFRDGLEFMHFFKGAAALFVQLVRPTIVLWGKSDYWEQRTGVNAEASSSLLRHELTHRVASTIYARQPQWFAEGLAQYLATMTVSKDGTTATVGELDPEAMRKYRRHKVSVSDMLAWNSYADIDENTMQGLYGVSWLTVHFLYDKHAAEFKAFQQALVRGVLPERAWKKTFGSLHPETLDAQLREYAERGSFKTVVVPVEGAGALQPFLKATITSADVHALRAQLALTGANMNSDSSGLRAEAWHEIKRALKAEPANALAVRLLQATGKHIPPADLDAALRAQVRRRPDDGDAWLLLADLGPPEGREAAARKAAELMPTSAEAIGLLAWYLGAKGRTEEAVQLAAKAASLAPWDAKTLHIYAVVLSHAGRCADAIEAQSRAIGALPDGRGRSPFAEEMRRKLEELRHGCAKGKPRG